MITAQRHVREWLIKHHTSAIELSAMVGKSPTYVPSFLSPSGGNAAAIKIIDPVVHFPPKIMEDVDNEIALKRKKRRWQVDFAAQGRRNDAIREWKLHKLSKEAL